VTEKPTVGCPVFEVFPFDSIPKAKKDIIANLWDKFWDRNFPYAAILLNYNCEFL